MRFSIGLLVASSLAAKAITVPAVPQHIFTASIGGFEEGVGHFSEWSKATKRDFIDSLNAGGASNWTVVMGNEGGDLDSMAAALTWAYHLFHIDPSKPAVALLQTPQDALDLRPENKLALSDVKMSPGHRDLLTIDELPVRPKDLAPKLRGIVLVDHPVPLSVWKDAKILSIFDHHTDRGAAPSAHPRVFERTASCTTIVAKAMLDGLEALPSEYHLPHEVLELALAAIALDSDGLNRGIPEDRETAARLLKRSNFHKEKLSDVMDRLDDRMGKAKKDLDALNVRDLLRRDWKGDIVETSNTDVPGIHLGFASMPISLSSQIERTLHNTTEEWFSIESAWTEEIGADVSVALTSFKIEIDKLTGEEREVMVFDDEDNLDDDDVTTRAKQKIRQVILVVRSDKRVDEKQADSLFAAVSAALADSGKLDAKPWSRAKELGHRQMVWKHTVQDGGRKLIRPIVEDAVKGWKG